MKVKLADGEWHEVYFVQVLATQYHVDLQGYQNGPDVGTYGLVIQDGKATTVRLDGCEVKP